MSPPVRPAAVSTRGAGLALALGSLPLVGTPGCALDTGGMGGTPIGVVSAGDSESTTSDAASSGEGLDDTGPPLPEGPRKRRLELDPTFAGVPGGAPLLLVLDDERIEYADTLPDGADLRVLGPEEDVDYPIEIERWDPQGRSFVWVRVDGPALPDHLWLYYGDDEGSAALDPVAVWDGAFAAVWHMERGAHSRMPDSTGAGLDLEFAGFLGQLDVVGAIGRAASFEPPAMLGQVGPLELPSPDALALTDGFTLEAWVPPAVTSGDTTHFVMRKAGAFELTALAPTVTRPTIVVHTAGQGPHEIQAGSSLALDAWTYVAASYRPDDGTLTLYRNGVLVGSVTVPGDEVTRVLADSTAVFQVGRGFHGTLDEIRVSTVARSAEWIELQHASMSDQLLSFGPPLPR